MDDAVLLGGDIVLADTDFELYKSTVKYWMDFFGLSKEWEIYFKSQVLENSALAQVDLDHAGKRLRFSITPVVRNANHLVVSRDIQRWAFHEVCEVLLDGMETAILDMWKRSDENADPDWNVLNERRHAVIRRLENSVFEALQE